MPASLLEAISAGLNGESPSGAADESAQGSDDSQDQSADVGSQTDGESSTDGDSTQLPAGSDASEDAAADDTAGDESAEDEGEGDEADGEGDDADRVAADKAGSKADKAKPVEPPAPKAKDPINDPIDQRLKTETKERMTSLIETVKTVTTERDTIKRDFEDVMGAITQTRATPVQYTEMLDYLAAVNSGDPVKIEKVITKVQNELRALASMIGKPVPGVDMLSEHADLVAEINAGKLTRARGEEIAATRARNALHTRASEAHTQTAEQQRQQQEIQQQGVSALNALGAQLQADPHFAYKKAAIADAMKVALPRIDPRQWATVWKEAYDKVPAPKPVVQPRPKNQPLRATNPAGGAGRAPANVGEAISAIDFSQIR